MGVIGSIGSFLGGWFSSAAKPAPPTKASGSDNVLSYGGYLSPNESAAALNGAQKWITYANTINTAIVATGVRYFGNLLAGTEWHAEPNELGGRDAQKAADIVTEGLLKAQMSRPWGAIVRKSSMYRLYGFSIHEWIVKRRSDGMMVFADIQHRPQNSIDRWNKPDEQKPFEGVEQLTRSGNRYYIPRNRLFYAFDDTLTDSPDGIGLLRHVVELERRLTRLQELEGLAYDSDMAGTPVGRGPIGELFAQFKNDKSAVDAATKNLRDILQHRIKNPDKLEWLLLDSATYQGVDRNTISAIQKWAIDILKGETNGLPDINVVIGRLQFEIARVLGIDFALIGADGGSYAMHEDKTSMFATNLQCTLTELAGFATNDLARTLTAFNGYDPETCTPRLVAEPISTDAIETTTRSLANMALAALPPNDPARNVLRHRMRLPPEPEPTPEMLGAIPKPKPTPPDPNLGEQDVPLDDLGSTDSGNGKAAA